MRRASRVGRIENLPRGPALDISIALISSKTTAQNRLHLKLQAGLIEHKLNGQLSRVRVPTN